MNVDLELQPNFAHAYTIDEIEKNLALAEAHAKQFGSVSAHFCKDCLRKHFVLIEGLAEEEINFTQNPEEKIKFGKIAEIMRRLKNKVDEIDENVAFDMADKLRMIRKAMHSSPIVVSGIEQEVKEVRHPIARRFEDDAVLIGLVLFNVAIFSFLALKRR